MAAFTAAARTQLLTLSGAVLSEETVLTIRNEGRSPRHQELAVGHTSETPLAGAQKASSGMPSRVPVTVIAAYQLKPKDRATSLDTAHGFAASLRTKMLATTWLSTVGAVVSSTGLTVEPGADGWVWFMLSFNVQITLDIS
jgi:hypothetical protein